MSIKTSECSAIKEVPFTINLTLEEERKKLDELGKSIAAEEKLNYEGYIVYTEEPYSIEKAKPTLFFN